jgi:glycosyltransferase involved in cell wall biosynthesis
MRRPRVLLIAESANPEWTSVPLVGWNISQALLDVVDGHVVSQARNLPAIEQAGWVCGREFSAIDSELVAGPTWRLDRVLRRVTGLGWTASTALAAIPYYYFEHLVWRRFGKAIADRRFDLVHRVTPLSPTTPSLIAARCRSVGVPFIWGPLNGGVAWPPDFRHAQRREGEWLAYLRDAHRLLPGFRSSRADAAAIVVASVATWEQMAGYHDRCVYIPENGIDPARFHARPESTRDGPLRVVFVGRLVPYKGPDMLVEAAAPLVQAGLVTLDIVGDGPERDAVERQAAQAGVADRVRLHGWLPHPQVADRLAQSDVFAFPSVREFGGGAVVEAMAMGLVPVVVNYAGPGELVTDRTGVRIPMGPRDSVVARFRDVLSELARDRERVARLGRAARRRTEKWFTWQAKAAQLLEVYRWVLGERDKPDFGMPFPDERTDEE